MELNEVDQLRLGIKAMCRRVPASINSGGVMKARSYKEAAEAAYKLATSSKPSKQKLREAHARLAAFYS